MTTTTTTSFDPSVLLSPESVAHFLNGEQAAAEILRYTPATTSTSLGRTWNSSWIDLDDIYYLFYGAALTVASYALHMVCLRDLSKKTWVMSQHAFTDATAIKTQKVFQANLLSRAINAHRMDTADYFLQRSLRIPFPTHPNVASVDFFHQDGVCRGMCHWFVFLYFKTRAQFTHSEDHIRALGQQFAKGAPREAAFLQSLTLPPAYDLLHLQLRQDYSRISPGGKTIDQIAREFQCRLPGVYGIYTSTHQVVYIKINDNVEYLFDPNEGCIKIGSTELFKKAMERYFETHDNTKEIFVDAYTPR